MASVTVYTDFGVQKNKACHCFHCFLIYLLWSDGTGCHDLLGKTRLSRLTVCLPTTGLESAILWGSLVPFIGEWIRDQVLCAQFSSVTQLCPTLYNPMDCSSPGFPVHHQLLELAQTNVLESVMPSLAFWLRSSVVSVLISLCARGPHYS